MQKKYLKKYDYKMFKFEEKSKFKNMKSSTISSAKNEENYAEVHHN